MDQKWERTRNLSMGGARPCWSVRCPQCHVGVGTMCSRANNWKRNQTEWNGSLAAVLSEISRRQETREGPPLVTGVRMDRAPVSARGCPHPADPGRRREAQDSVRHETKAERKAEPKPQSQAGRADENSNSQNAFKKSSAGEKKVWPKSEGGGRGEEGEHMPRAHEVPGSVPRAAAALPPPPSSPHVGTGCPSPRPES